VELAVTHGFSNGKEHFRKPNLICYSFSLIFFGDGRRAVVVQPE